MEAARRDIFLEPCQFPPAVLVKLLIVWRFICTRSPIWITHKGIVPRFPPQSLSLFKSLVYSSCHANTDGVNSKWPHRYMKSYGWSVAPGRRRTSFLQGGAPLQVSRPKWSALDSCTYWQAWSRLSRLHMHVCVCIYAHLWNSNIWRGQKFGREEAEAVETWMKYSRVKFSKKKIKLYIYHLKSLVCICVCVFIYFLYLLYRLANIFLSKQDHSSSPF